MLHQVYSYVSFGSERVYISLVTDVSDYRTIFLTNSTMITESEAFIEEYKKKLAHESRVLANSLAPGAALRANIGDNDPTILVQPKSKPKPKTTFPVEKVAKISENQLKESAKIAVFEI